MPHLTLLVGPPGSGKSTYARNLLPNVTDFNLCPIYINQDSQGKQRHLELFVESLANNSDIIVDRMGFNAEQRFRYIAPAKMAGYIIKIVVLHQPYAVCLERCLNRKNHETITKEEHARSALQTFFTRYERPTLDEADVIEFIYPKSDKDPVIVSDIDGTAALVEHRRHYVEGKKGKDRNWKAFFKEMVNDGVNQPVKLTLQALYERIPKIIYCSGRPDNYRRETQEWLNINNFPKGDLLMRNRHDSRQDNIIKEIILDFEILTRYDVKVWLDDRNQVVEMLRKRNIPVFQVADGNF